MCAEIVVRLGILYHGSSSIMRSSNPSPETIPMGHISLHINLAILSVMAFLRVAGKRPAEAECAE